MVQVVSKLLDPKTSEFTATFVGRLVSILISKLGNQLGENLDLMLRAVLSKMQQAETLSVIQVETHIISAPRLKKHFWISSISEPKNISNVNCCFRAWCWSSHTSCTARWMPCWSFYAVSQAPPASLPWTLFLQNGAPSNICFSGRMKAKSGTEKLL